MVQIIGFLGCFYLLIKGFEIAGNNSHRGEDGLHNGQSIIAMLLCYLGSFAFAFWLVVQGGYFRAPSSTGYQSSMTQQKIDCISQASTTEEILACDR